MSRTAFTHCAVFLLVSLIPFGKLLAQGVCDLGNGTLNPAMPVAVTPEGIIHEFTAKEATYKGARNRYGYTITVTVQTLDNYDRVDGEYQQISEIVLDDYGKRVERTTFAPQNTLRRITLTEDDMDDIRGKASIDLTPEQLPHFSVAYAGRQRVDQLDTYVFDVSPKNPKKDKKLFEGRIWVDDQDLMIVKTCGKPREDENANSKKKNAFVNLEPTFVTYREQIDGRNWFPTYSRADELLRFPKMFVHVREVVKYTHYKPLAQK